MSGKTIFFVLLIFPFLFYSCVNQAQYEKLLDKEFFKYFPEINIALTGGEIKTITEITDNVKFLNEVYSTVKNKNIIFDSLDPQYDNKYNFSKVLLRLMPLAIEQQFGNDILEILIELNKKNNYQYNRELFFRLHVMILKVFSSSRNHFDKKLLKELYASFPNIKMLYLGSYGSIKAFKARYGDEAKFDYKKIYEGYVKININNFPDVLKDNDILLFAVTDEGYDSFCETLSAFLKI